jgi:hypothetical protein
MAHTPGPWNWTGLYIEDSEGMPIAQVRTPTILQGEANAALIAAAPDLLAALRLCLAQLTDERLGTVDYMEGADIYGDFEKVATVARAAIAAATTETT